MGQRKKRASEGIEKKLVLLVLGSPKRCFFLGAILTRERRKERWFPWGN